MTTLREGEQLSPVAADPQSVVDLLQSLRGFEERVVVDSAEGESFVIALEQGTYISLSASAYHLLKARRDGASFAQLAEMFGKHSGRSIDETEIAAAYNSLIGRIQAIQARAQRAPAGFLFRWKLIPAAAVLRIGSWLSVAFHAATSVLLLAAVVLSVFWASDIYKLHRFFSMGSTPSEAWWAYGLFLISVLFHEFGHASACIRFGARPSEIGATLYLIFPAFYSDVTAAWELRRWQRVIVDFAGVYFQAVIGVVYLALYQVYRWESLWLAWIMIVSSSLFVLNPILKFDGYWVVADALGVTNLSQQPMRILRHLIGKLRRDPSVKPLPWSPRVTGVLGLYTLVSFSVWFYFILYAMPRLWQYVAVYPAKLSELLGRHLASPGRSWSADLPELSRSTFVVILAILLTWRLLSPHGKKIWNLVSRRQEPAVKPKP
ncbi:MAG TPA: M50 family metallopeptidase [Thermoanaerobaculia bacterium]|nr:M50 family metallopeptidase [Thermoanaerobaculia bacterium]